MLRWDAVREARTRRAPFAVECRPDRDLAEREDLVKKTQVSPMADIMEEDQGAALVTVLLFMVLTFIFIMTMLAATSNEAIISGLHRDGVRALELAQGGVQEGIARIQQGHPYSSGFTSSLNPGVTVTVMRRVLGTNAAYQEIQATATIGRATRRVSALVLQRSTVAPPDITLAENVTQQGNAKITSGDAYARTFFVYKQNPTPGLTYAGWRMSKTPPGSVAPCYTNPQCAASGEPNWYPGTRRGAYQSSDLGADIMVHTNQCDAGGGGPLPTQTITGVLATDATLTSVTVSAYGFDRDNGSAVIPALPCGLPYEFVPQTFTDENGITQTILFKTIVYEQWLNTYWRFDEAQLVYVKTDVLMNHPEFGAVPPFPEVSTLEANYDQVYTPSTGITNGLGTADQPLTVLLEGEWQLNGNLTGFGTLIVDGSLILNGTFQYWGTVIVNGTFVEATGNATITGGLVARSTLDLSGNFSVNGGGAVPSGPVGHSLVTAKAWWER